LLCIFILAEKEQMTCVICVGIRMVAVMFR